MGQDWRIGVFGRLGGAVRLRWRYGIAMNKAPEAKTLALSDSARRRNVATSQPIVPDDDDLALMF